MRSTDRLRTALTVVSLAAPLIAVVLTRLAWLPELPANVAFHWDAAGRPDGTVPAEALSTVAIVGSALGLLAGAAVLSLPRTTAKDKRDYLFWAGSLAGLPAGVWLVCAGLTHAAGAAGRAELGGWIAALALAAFYGVVPYLLAPTTDHDTQKPPA